MKQQEEREECRAAQVRDSSGMRWSGRISWHWWWEEVVRVCSEHFEQEENEEYTLEGGTAGEGVAG